MVLAVDCQRVSEEHLADLYAMGRLDEADAEAFEDHYMLCETCVAELEQAELRVRGFKRLGADAATRDPEVGVDAAPSAGSVVGGAGRFLRDRSIQTAGLALAAALTLAVVGLPYLLSSGSGSTSASSGAVAVFHLQPERSSEGRAGHRVLLPDEPLSIVLALELDPPFYDSYRATLRRGDEQLWQGDGLRLGERDTVHLSLDTRLLRAGDDHVVLLDGLRDGEWVEVTRFPFHATDDG